MDDTVEISSVLVHRLVGLMWSSGLEESLAPRQTEHCGILRGQDGRITDLLHARNVSEAPETSFEIDPATLLGAYREERRNGALRVLGFFHTHPSGDPTPSRRDAESAAPDGKLWLIATATRVRIWRALPHGPVHARFAPVRFDLRSDARIERGLMEVRHVGHGHRLDVRLKDPPA